MNSCRRRAASVTASWRAISTSGLIRGDLLDLALGDVPRVDAGDGVPFAVDGEHDVGGLGLGLLEELHQNHDHEFHRRVVVVVKEHLVELGGVGLGPLEDLRLLLALGRGPLGRRRLFRGLAGRGGHGERGVIAQKVIMSANAAVASGDPRGPVEG
jgi:hypothetical protein